MNKPEHPDEALALPNCKNCGHRQIRHTNKKPNQKGFPCEVCDCKDYAPISLEIPEYQNPLNDKSSVQYAEHKVYPVLRKWAHSYNGYHRIAGKRWSGLLEPIWEEAHAQRKIPDWVGIDILRGWAFFSARSHQWSCMNDSSYSCCPIMYAIAEAVRNHEHATKKDMPPPIAPIILESTRTRRRR